MRIAIYSHSIAPSIDGVCRRFTALLTELSRLGHEILLFTLEDKPLDIPNNIKNIITLDHMFIPSYPEKKVARPSINSMMKVWNGLRMFKPSVVHCTADGFSHMFTLLGLILNIPIVGSFHTDLMDLLSTHNATMFQKGVVCFKEQIDSIVFDSCATTSLSFKNKLGKVYIDCQHIIATAVDIEKFTESKKKNSIRNEMTFGDEKGFLCVYVGRISREKRIDIIAEAMKSIDGAYLAIIGDGPSANIYKGLHGKENRIYCQPRFLSHSELAEIYASSDVHVSASEFETLGNTVLEAFACNIPVVVPRTQGFMDTVTDGKDGFLFTPGDYSSARSFLQKLRDNSRLRIEMGKSGREKVSKLTITNVVNDLISWYELGINRRNNRSLLYKLPCVLLLFILVPFGMITLAIYDILMAVLACFGYSAKEAAHHSSSSKESKKID